MKLLLVHRTGPHGLGDRIRVQAIIDFLKNNCYHVQEVCLPLTSASLNDFLKAMPFMHLTPQFSSINAALKDCRLSVTFNVVYNYLENILKKIEFDAILAETTPVGWLILRWLKKHHVTAPLLIDIHGLWFAEAKGWNKKNWLMLKRIESETLRDADYLFVVSDAMKDFITNNLGVDKNKITVVTNGAPPIEKLSAYKMPFKVIYAGIFDYYENVDIYLELTANCSDKRLKFFMAGRGPLLKKILTYIKREKAPICFLGYIPRRGMLQILATFQAGLIFSTKDIAREVAFPIKILDYASRGLPVIAPKIGDWGHLVETEDIGISVENGIAEYANALQVLMDKYIWLRKRRNCIDFARRYQWRNVLWPMKEVLDKF